MGVVLYVGELIGRYRKCQPTAKTQPWSRSTLQHVGGTRLRLALTGDDVIFFLVLAFSLVSISGCCLFMTFGNRFGIRLCTGLKPLNCRTT